MLEGGGEILDSEKPHFTRKQIKDHWRLGCQCKVKGDLKIKVPESVMGVKEWYWEKCHRRADHSRNRAQVRQV